MDSSVESGINGAAANGMTFKERKTLEMRKDETQKLRANHPSKIPVILEKDGKKVQLAPLEKVKFLVPDAITLGQFQAVIRKRMNLSPTQTLDLLVNNKSLALYKSLKDIYRDECDEDGFLYMVYASKGCLDDTEDLQDQDERFHECCRCVLERVKQLEDRVGQLEKQVAEKK